MDNNSKQDDGSPEEDLHVRASKSLFSNGIIVADGDEGYQPSDAIRAQPEMVDDVKFLFRNAGKMLTSG